MKKYLLSAVGLLVITIVLAIGTSTTAPLFATTGMPPGGVGEEQRDLVGNEDEHDRDGPGGDGGAGVDDDNDDPDGKEANCWGEVTRDFAHDGDEDGQPGLGQHSRNPSPDPDNDTPREGVGNQDEDHPSDHADSVGDRISDAKCVNRD
jgi:hypothetical protein